MLYNINLERYRGNLCGDIFGVVTMVTCYITYTWSGKVMTMVTHKCGGKYTWSGAVVTVVTLDTLHSLCGGYILFP